MVTQIDKYSSRGITSITYDYGHHPYKIAMSTKKKDITNDYTPDGRKLSNRHLAYIPKGNGYFSRITVTDLYIDGLILRGGKPLMWQFEGGYVDLDDNGSPTGWNYYVTDHLGSTRKVVGSDNTVRETISYYPFGSEMTMQDPAQMSNNFQHPYRFTGKELDRLNGLNMYDFGARWYDVAGVPMWTSVDPLAEKYYHVSPYVYCFGNPVMLVDPDGKETKIPMPGIYSGVIIAGHHNTKTIAFYITHPRIASSIGSPNEKGTISNTASNFEINIAKGTKGLEHGSPGDEGNAIRHTIWQAMITNNYGEEIASTVAYCHEDNWKITNQETVFKNKEAGDTYVDLKNNAIGRYIGKNNPNATNKQLITKVMQHYHSKGLYVLKKEGDTWKPVLDKITQQQLKQAIQIIQTKNENGLAK